MNELDYIEYPVESVKGLVFRCYYYYEEARKGSLIDPPEPAQVDISRVFIGDTELKSKDLTTEQWVQIEQWIYEQRESD